MRLAHVSKFFLTFDCCCFGNGCGGCGGGGGGVGVVGLDDLVKNIFVFFFSTKFFMFLF
jgi:hypothetical protein